MIEVYIPPYAKQGKRWFGAHGQKYGGKLWEIEGRKYMVNISLVIQIKASQEVRAVSRSSSLLSKETSLQWKFPL